MSLHETYDVIFAGGGTVACIVAGRLAQADPKLKILIIEAGPHSRDLHQHVQPARYLHSLGQGHTFSHHVGVPSQALGGRSAIIPSGRCLGGGSSVNFMMYTRCPASDYDDFEKLGNPGWGSKDLIPLSRKVETYQIPSGDPSVHGFTGPIKVSHGGHDSNIGKDFLDAAARYDKDRGSSADINDFTTTNVYGPWHKYIDAHTGKRSDTAHHFIYSLDEESKRNLHILTDQRVVKVIFENTRAVGVEYALDKFHTGAEATQRVFASRLIVLSSGAFGSPAILERSGIGSATHLAQANVRQIVDLPGVGENYNDHNLYITTYLASEDSDCMDGIFAGDEEAIKPHLTEWTKKGTGFLASNSIDSGIKLHPTPKDLEELGPSFRKQWEEFFVGAPDKAVAIMVSSSGNLAAVEPVPKGWKTFSMVYYTLYPRAIGYTHISSGTNPWAPLKFDPGYLEDPGDVAVLRWCYKRGRELARRMKSFRGEIPGSNPAFQSPSNASSVPHETSTAADFLTAPGPIDVDAREVIYSAEDDKAIDDHIRANVSTTWHSLGTCAMKARKDGGVVDPRLNVYGVENLKVADLSIVPLNVGSNTYNTALVVGEKAFLIIAEDLGVAA
ncbi:GMC oxidoreductase-domain-containing protein [Rhodocollybia butyracea]|uniref:GMC oxidoreductase-domain-containing protein n=1 Tax=Rhodocollybia butyracea TaxID=206335 RepID=A0A9P5PKI0_9AGAR|nr:GMC oxidoreductase-domain-containing protein [Rhodocollybia butyracea]